MAAYLHIFNMDTFDTIGPIPNDERFLRYAGVISTQFVETTRLMLPGSQWHNTRILCVGDDCKTNIKYYELMDTVKTNVPSTYAKSFSFDDNENLTLNNICCLLLPKEVYGGKEVRFIFNHFLEEYIDFEQIRDKANTVNPLYLLTLVSEPPENLIYGIKDIIGLWCGHPLSASDTLDLTSYKRIDLGFMNGTK